MYDIHPLVKSKIKKNNIKIEIYTEHRQQVPKPT